MKTIKLKLIKKQIIEIDGNFYKVTIEPIEEENKISTTKMLHCIDNDIFFKYTLFLIKC